MKENAEMGIPSAEQREYLGSLANKLAYDWLALRGDTTFLMSFFYTRDVPVNMRPLMKGKRIVVTVQIEDFTENPYSQEQCRIGLNQNR